ncbi:MAG: hypothetical protein J7621_14715 [Niastella sp.]|nr:hypothetical protein [Niastella sp.]
MEEFSWIGSDTVSFYRLPEDTLAYVIMPGQVITWPAKIKNAVTGNYRVRYMNNYGQVVNKVVTLTEKLTNNVALCPDKLLAYPQNTLAKLQEKDSIVVWIHSSGCYHASGSKIVIIKVEGQLVARLYNASWKYVKKGRETVVEFKDGKLLQTTTMNQEGVQGFIQFENELNYVKDGGCTSTDLYDVKSKYLNVNKTDGSCSWHGAYRLRKSIFGEEVKVLQAGKMKLTSPTSIKSSSASPQL